MIILRERADYLDAFFSEPLLRRDYGSFRPTSADRSKHRNNQMLAAVTLSASPEPRPWP